MMLTRILSVEGAITIGIAIIAMYVNKLPLVDRSR